MGIELTPQEKALKELAVMVNEVGYKELAATIQQKLNQLDTESQLYYLEEVYEKHFVYRIEYRDGTIAFNLFQQKYAADKNGAVEFEEQPNPVIKSIIYVTETQTNKGGMKIMGDKDKPCCPEKVELLVQSNSFKEEARDWLSTLEEKTIDSFLAMDTVNTDLTTQLAAVKEKSPEKKKEDTPVQMNKEQAISVLKEQLSDTTQFLELLPVEQREQMQHGLSLFQSRKQELITHITTNAADVYTVEDVTSMDIGALEKLAKAVKAPVDYSALGGAPQTQTGPAPLLPPGVVAS